MTDEDKDGLIRAYEQELVTAKARVAELELALAAKEAYESEIMERLDKIHQWIIDERLEKSYPMPNTTITFPNTTFGPTTGTFYASSSGTMTNSKPITFSFDSSSFTFDGEASPKLNERVVDQLKEVEELVAQANAKKVVEETAFNIQSADMGKLAE